LDKQKIQSYAIFINPDTGYAGQVSFAIIGLAAPGESGYNLSGQISKDGNTGNTTVLLNHTNGTNTQTCQVLLTPTEFEAYRLFVAKGF
jgi:hypothetical protein